MLRNFVIDTLLPCSLHCILAHHRYLWKFLFNVISNRGQEPEIPAGLRHIGCDYLAFQYESYLKRFVLIQQVWFLSNLGILRLIFFLKFFLKNLCK